MEALRDPLRLSLQVTGLATLILFPAGLAVGTFLGRVEFRGGVVEETLILLPPSVVGYYLLVALGSGSPVRDWLGLELLFTWWAAALASAVVGLPLMVQAAVANVDPTLIRAARTLGASEVGVFFRVILPLARRGVLVGLVLGAARALGEFGATLMVAGSIPGRTQTLPLAIYDAVQMRDYALANQMVLLLTALSFLGLLWVIRNGGPQGSGRPLIGTRVTAPDPAPRPASRPALRMDLSVRRGGFRLDVSLEAEEGVVVLFGPSGEGKSTALENVAFPLRGVEGGRRRALDLLARMSLEPFADRFPVQLSGGQQQRAAIARALAADPRALLLDEPFAALDLETRRSVGGEIRKVLRELRIPVLLVTHDREDALALGDRLVILDSGGIVADGIPAELLGRPARERVARLVEGGEPPLVLRDDV